MQITKIDKNLQTNFKAIKAESVKNILKTNRLIGLTTGRPKEYRELVNDQLNNPFDIILTKGRCKSLKAKIISKDGDCVWKYKESIFDGIINSNPNKFIQKMCKMANYFKNNPEMAQFWIAQNNRCKKA